MSGEPRSRADTADEAHADMPGADVRVRAIARADVARVHALMRGLAEYERLTDIFTGTPEMLERALFVATGPRLEGLVAERAGRFVGYALFYPVFGSFRARWRMWLEDVYVDPAERGGGTGRRLMAELARIAAERDWIAIDWEVLDWNAPALGFYEHLGASRIAADWHRYRLTGDALATLAAEARAR
jgi:GNAT superfamily N-acetyltransferase